MERPKARDRVLQDMCPCDRREPTKAQTLSTVWPWRCIRPRAGRQQGGSSRPRGVRGDGRGGRRGGWSGRGHLYICTDYIVNRKVPLCAPSVAKTPCSTHTSRTGTIRCCIAPPGLQPPGAARIAWYPQIAPFLRLGFEEDRIPDAARLPVSYFGEGECRLHVSASGEKYDII